MQIVSESTDTPFQTTSGSYVNTGIEAEITLNDSGNTVHLTGAVTIGTSDGTYAVLRVTRNGTEIGGLFTVGAQTYVDNYVPINIIDTPGSTGPHTYRVQVRREDGSGNIFINRESPASLDTTSTLTLVEYGAGGAGGGDSLWQQTGDDIYYNAGNVGIGMDDPKAALDVAGAVRIGTMAACGADEEGAIRYTGGDPPWEFCDGDDWVDLLGGSGSGSRWTLTGDDIYYNAGNVGIGTDDPDEILSVRGDVASELRIRLRNMNSNGLAEFVAGNDLGDEIAISSWGSDWAPYGDLLPRDSIVYSYPRPLSIVADGWGEGIIKLLTGNDSDPLERMRIDPDGNVGIGTDTPQAMLDVDGTVRLRGTPSTAFGNYFPNLEINQAAVSGLRYLLLAKKDSDHAVDGWISGRRRVGTSGRHSLTAYVKILHSSADQPVVHWETTWVRNMSDIPAVVELMYNGEPWFALNTANSGASAPLNEAIFTGSYTEQPDQFKWVNDTDVSDVVRVISDHRVNIGDKFYIDADGSVGIGMIEPKTALDVAGAVRIGTMAACGPDEEGALRYTGGDPPWEYCDGDDWRPFESAAEGGPPCTDNAEIACFLDETRSLSDPDFIAGNIAAGINILGVIGTLDVSQDPEVDVTWDPDNKANAVSLQNGNLDATASNSEGVVVATHALDGTTGQKAYFEIEVISTHNSAEVGIKDDNFSNLNNWHYNIAGSNVHYDNWFREFEVGTNSTAGWSVEAGSNPSTRFSAGDRLMWALDRSSGKIWHGRNGTWFHSGDPAAGSNPTFSADPTERCS